jgi:hypothetical protein
VTAPRSAAAIVALAGLVLAATACGVTRPARVAQLGTTTTRSASSASDSPQTGALAFAHCMRSEGVLSFPDPGAGGVIPKESLQQLGVSSTRFQAAVQACRHLLPGGGRTPDQAERQQVTQEGVQFARCVRSHGVPNFPDPGSDGRIPDPATVGVDQGSPKFRAANQACGRYRPPYIPSNAAYDSWARTHGG